MEFMELYNRVSSRLKRIARDHNGYAFFIDENDLYQEMCIYLWNNYKDGVPPGIKDSYIIKGCEFHILNYIRTKKDKVQLLSLEKPLDERGGSLKDVLVSKIEPLDRCVDRTMSIDDIKQDGFTKREKQVFSLLLQGDTVREAGKKLGISHVMVIKLKKKLINKWQRKKKEVTRRAKNLLTKSSGLI